jgi:hypothetical protein
MNFPHGKAQIPKGNICFKSLCNHKHLMFFLYRITTYHCKVIQEIYIFVIESISIKIHIKTLQSNNFWTNLFPTEHGCSLRQLRSLFLSLGDDMVAP